MRPSTTAREHAERFARKAMHETDDKRVAYYRKLAATWQAIAQEQDFTADLKATLLKAG